MSWWWSTWSLLGLWARLVCRGLPMQETEEIVAVVLMTVMLMTGGEAAVQVAGAVESRRLMQG